MPRFPTRLLLKSVTDALTESGASAVLVPLLTKILDALLSNLFMDLLNCGFTFGRLLTAAEEQGQKMSIESKLQVSTLRSP